MKVYNIILTLLLCYHSYPIFSQTVHQKGYIIKGHIGGIPDGTEVYLIDIDGQSILDSSVTSQGHFSFHGSVKNPTSCWIRCQSESAVVEVENTNLTFESPIENMHVVYKAEGGKEQSLLNEMRAMQAPYERLYWAAYDSLMKEKYTNEEQKKRLIQIFNSNQDSSQAIYVEFGKRHPNSFLGLDNIYRNRAAIGKDTIARLLSQLTGKYKLSNKAQALRTFLEPTAEKGKRYINFTVKRLDGSPFTLSSLEGNYILLSFGSAGCGPCRMENKNISKNYSKIKDKVSIVSFSLDPEKEMWLKASQDDHILWTNVSDLKGDAGKIKTQYDVQAIPTSFLINKEGVIVEKFTGFSDNFLDDLVRLVSSE